MEIWESINQTLSIIAWPAVTLAAFWMFRGKIGGLIARLGEIEAFGARIKAARIEKVSDEFGDRAREVVESRAIEAGENSKEKSVESGSVGGNPEPPIVEKRGTALVPAAEVASTGDVDGASQPLFTQSQVEEFIRAAGVAGYETGAIRMFQGPVEPVIEWTDDNVPKIHHWEGASRSTGTVPYDPTERVHRLEREIRDLTSKVNSPIAGVSGVISGERQTLQDLRRQLLRLDPNSPWAG